MIVIWTLPGTFRPQQSSDLTGADLGDAAAQQSANFVIEATFLSIATLRLSYSLAVRDHFNRKRREGWAMDPFKKKRFLLPIEVMIALALNVVVVVLGYYAMMMWGFFRG